MSIKEYIHLILGVLADFRVIGTVIVCLLVIEFAKFITTYRKRPPRPKAKKQKAAPAPAQVPAETAPAESAEESAE